jgi:hypothetical protein
MVYDDGGGFIAIDYISFRTNKQCRLLILVYITRYYKIFNGILLHINGLDRASSHIRSIEIPVCLHITRVSAFSINIVMGYHKFYYVLIRYNNKYSLLFVFRIVSPTIN